MTSRKLCKSIKNIAWGYVLIHLHFLIGTFDLLPDWVGYFLFLGALPIISTIEPSATSIKPIGILLTIWHGVLWILSLFGITSLGYFPELLFSIISLYFHFRLLTMIAGVAKAFDCPEEKGILRLRTARTIIAVLSALPLPWDEYPSLSFIIFIITLIIIFLLLWVLFSLHRTLKERSLDE